MTGLVKTTIATVQRISADLRPAVLDDAGLVGGDITIHGAVGEGTTVVVRVPLPSIRAAP